MKDEFIDTEFKQEKPESKTKNCKYCKEPIRKKAKVCPYCHKKQSSGCLVWIVGLIIVIALLPMLVGNENNNKVNKAQSSGSSENPTNTEEINNVFNVGDVIETKNFKITYISTGEYTSNNQFLQPKDGFVYWEFEFQFENISDSDQVVSSMMDWECYADNTKADQTWIGDNDGLDATLSSGRITKGTIYFEVPKNAEIIELEYNINFWEDDKVIFIGK